MADQTQRLEIATVRAEVGSNILYRVANDPVAADPIPTESGDIQNLKQIIVGIESKASISTSIYPDVATGLAATVEGGMFLVASSESDEIYTVWKKMAGAAVDTGKRALNAQAVESSVISAASSASQAASAAGNAAAEFETIFEADQNQREASFAAAQAQRASQFAADQAQRAIDFNAAQVQRNDSFNAWFDASGFENPPLPYVDGSPLVVARVTQLIVRAGNLYTVKRPASFPFALTGSWATDAPKLVAREDQALRQDLADPLDPVSGAAMVAYRGRTVKDRLDDELTSTALGLKSDGTDQSAALLSAIALANGRGKALVVDAVHSVLPIVLPANGKLIFKGGSLKALASGALLTISSGTQVVDADLDLNGVSSVGVRAISAVGFALKGKTQVRKAATGGADYNGGVLLSSCSNFSLGDIYCEGINQVGPGVAGLYRSVDLSSCFNFRAGSIFVDNCDMGLNLYGCDDFVIDLISGQNLSDNLLYILNATKNGDIIAVEGNNIEEGVVLNSSVANANITIGSAKLTTTSNKGVTLRTGGGYHFGSLSLTEASLAQDSGFSGCGLLTIGSMTSYMTAATSRPVTLNKNNGVTIGVAEIFVTDTLGGYPVLVTDCDDLMIGVLKITGLTSAVPNGIRVVDGTTPIANPRITVGELQTKNVTTPYNLLNTGKANVTISHGADRYGQLLKLTHNGPASLALENRQVSMVAGETFGKIEFISSDTSGPGVKFTIESQAEGPTGAAGKTVMRNDKGEIVARVPTGQGMAIKLPTSSSGLESGMIWNNSGTISVVP